MSSTVAGSLPPRKSFAQVAAAANEPIIKEKPKIPSSEPVKPQNGVPRFVKSSAPRINLPENATKEENVDHRLSPVSPRGGDVGIEGLANALQATMIAAHTGVGSMPTSGLSKKESSDTKSVTSRTTLTLDEKESLRPDDSASMQAAIEEDAFSTNGSIVTNSKPGSERETRAFREQLNDISINGEGRVIMPRAQRPERIGEHDTRGIIFSPPAGSMESIGAVPLPVEIERPVVPSPSMWIVPPDPKLSEALESPKDRLFVLKVEQDLIDFVKDPKEEFLQLPGTNSFYRMLSHKLADYYMLGHVVDDTMSSVRIYRTPHTRLPPPLINSNPRTTDSTPPPTAATRKIMRRNGANRSFARNGAADSTFDSLTSSKATSDVGSGSDERKDSKTAERSGLTREERENRYKEARARIFKDFEEKEILDVVNAEKDMSRSSSMSGAKKINNSSGNNNNNNGSSNNNNKKQRKPKDDAFEARSAFDALGRRISDNGYSQTPSDTPPFDQYFFESQGAMPPYGQPFPVGQAFAMPYNVADDGGPSNANSQWQHQNMPTSGYHQMQYPTGGSNMGQEGYNMFPGGYEVNQFPPNLALERTPKGTTPALATFGQGYMQPQQMGWTQEGYMSSFANGEYQYQDGNGPYAAMYNHPMSAPMSPNGYEAFSTQSTPANYNQGYFSGNLDSASFDPRSRAFVPAIRGSTNSHSMNPFPQAQNGFQMQRQPSNNGNMFSANYKSIPPPYPTHPHNNTNTNTHHRRPSGNSRGRGQAQAGANPNPNGRPQAHPSFQASSISKWATPASLPAKPPVPSAVSGGQQLPPKPVATR